MLWKIADPLNVSRPVRSSEMWAFEVFDCSLATSGQLYPAASERWDFCAKNQPSDIFTSFAIRTHQPSRRLSLDASKSRG